MKTKSTGCLVLLDTEEYRGFWSGFVVTVPFSVEDVVFDVDDYSPKRVEVTVKVQNEIAYIEPI